MKNIELFHSFLLLPQKFSLKLHLVVDSTVHSSLVSLPYIETDEKRILNALIMERLSTQEREAQDAYFMRLALDLAQQGGAYTAPNPMVGAIVVKDGEIIGKGFHSCYGKPHAEVEALQSCKEDVKGATIYVTLEPCSHYGKTPPCAKTLLESGIKRVVCAMEDPNPKVSGRGIEMLRNGGVEVVCGVLEEEARWLNRAFIKHITTQIPYIVVKSATTADGKIATSTGHSQWITNSLSRERVHVLRNRCGGILTSISTAEKDDPMLNCRLTSSNEKIHQPTRLIADTLGRLSAHSKIAQSAKEISTYLFHSNGANKENLDILRTMGVRTHLLPLDAKGHISLKELFYSIGGMGINSVLVEAGGRFNAALWEGNWVDEFYLFIAPKIVGGENALSSVEGEGIEDMNYAKKLSLRSVEPLGEDILIHYTVPPSKREL